MKNMLDAVTARLRRPILAVLGGTHLVESKGEGLERSLAYLNDGDIKIVGVSHCTGKEAVERLRASNAGFFHNVTGSSLIVE
jgi:7,8-dihydropterin-6-yl-methyl-4-(beta-D-ribofuranosyl)aminobenzene 5'-phosphate synthase